MSFNLDRYRRISQVLITVLIAVTVYATAYDAPCRKCGTKKRTITGKSTRTPGVASRRWPIGTVLYIQGIGRRVVDDRCHGALDIRFTGKDAHKRARSFGRKKLKVRVLHVKPHISARHKPHKAR